MLRQQNIIAIGRKAAASIHPTPALSYDQDYKKGINKRSMHSGPILRTDTGKYCQNLETLGKYNFWKFWFLDRVVGGPPQVFETP